MDALYWYYGYLCFFFFMIFLDKCIRDRRRQSTSTTDIEAQNPPPIQTRRIDLHHYNHQVGLYSQAPAPAPARVDEKRIKEIEKACTECVICLGEYDDDGCDVGYRTLMPCGHRFHRLCIQSWLEKEGHRRCPICRRLVDRR